MPLKWIPRSKQTTCYSVMGIGEGGGGGWGCGGYVLLWPNGGCT